ncbi:UNVERIFIED_CONTAM: hypothetical protein PYX00_002833 [Menopon gallinae]|uniref:Fatty acid desaturase domain-containing protein n=1 Tax=Menopon gallinae TaxID=328185 RepID=A0AAW2HXX2_9NEOP
MAPNGMISSLKAGILPEVEDADQSSVKEVSEQEEKNTFRPQLIWINIISITLLHAVAVFSTFKWYADTKVYTYIWGFVIGALGAFGVTGGAHRLWTHRSYKAKWPLRLILMICYSIAGQNTLYDWVRDHRVHHKYSETDADPHNSNRGFFFAHVGWLMQKKHPEVIKKGKLMDMSDVLEDPIVRFHQKYFTLLKLLCCFIIPTAVPCYFWDEKFLYSFLGIGCVRYVLGLNFTWLVNSVAHMWGYRPYDQRINPTENLAVAIVAFGEGWHNYHHVFPWDYKAAEMGNYVVNFTTMWLDLFAKIGWAYDLKEPSRELVRKIAEKYGDGSHEHCPSTHEVDETGNVINCCYKEVDLPLEKKDNKIS